MIGTSISKHLLDNCQFRESHLKNRFWKGQIDANILAQIFDWNDLNRCLSFNRITNDRFRLSTSSEHHAANRRAFRPTRDSLGRSTDYLVVTELHKLMREGVTAVLEAVNELSAPVCELTEHLAGELGARSTANAYVSFGSVSGFGMHNDDHDVIVLQLDGRKEWRFLGNGAGDKATVADLKPPAGGEQYESIIASAGDVMYIPKGTWHDVAALNERSLHLTVSVVYPTVAEYVTWCIHEKKMGISSQDIKPNNDCVDRTIAYCRHFGETITRKTNVQDFLNAFYADKRCTRTRANFPSLNIPNKADRFRRITFDVLSLGSPLPDRHDTYALGRIHSLSTAEYTVLRRLPTVGAMTGAEIAEVCGGWETTSPVLEALMDRDLVTTVMSEA